MGHLARSMNSSIGDMVTERANDINKYKLL